MKKLNLVFVITVTLILSTMFARGAIASSNPPSITLAPGEIAVVTFTNNENIAENLNIQNISAPNQLLSYVIFSPTSIPANSVENVTIQFVYIPFDVYQALPKDKFAISVGELCLYLDLTENQPSQENIDNITAELTALRAELNSLRTSISINLDNLRLQNMLQDWRIDNLTQYLTALQDNIARINIRLDALFAKVYENSPYDNYDVEIKNMRDWVQGANDNIWAQVNGTFAQQDVKILAMQEAVDENRTYAYAGIGMAIGVVFFMLLMMRFKKSASSPATVGKPVNPDAPKPDAPLEKIPSM